MFVDGQEDPLLNEEQVGTDEETLTRIIVGRSEIDLEDIKERFFDRYKKSLGKMIEDDCGGLYKHMLIAIVKD